MAIDYSSFLTAEQKLSLLNQRIQGFAAEAYQHELNKQIAVSINDEKAIADADVALATLELAINVHQAEVASLETASTEAE